MPYSRSVDSNGFLITTLQGVVTLKEAIELADDLHNHIKNGEFFELVLHADDVKIALDPNEAEISASTLMGVLKTVKRGGMAFVSNKDVVYGLCRQLQTRAENAFFQLCVFRTEDTARAWLHEMCASPLHGEQTRGQ